ncbi:MAG TPA: hypothetical protein DHW49_02520 [Anaerolineae bacterium]|nr:hypothetical protein [Anaerolineae bacterium]
MKYENLKTIAIYLALGAIFLIPRLSKIDSVVTLDEPSWLSQGANFYYALGQREFENTIYEYQPAVTTMSIISLAMHIYFPEYRGLGQGYFDYEKSTLESFMESHNKDPLVLLKYSRIIQVFVLLILFLVLYYLLQKLLPKWIAFFAIVFASLDPFWMAHARMMDHEAMVSSFVIISILSLLIYFTQGKKIFFLLLSGFAAGFAQLTKSSAIAMLATIGILLLIQIYQERGQGWLKAFLNQTKVFGIWLAVLAITYFVFWPGMWVAPGKMLYQVYGNAFSFAFQGARLTVTEELNVEEFSLNTNATDVWDVAKILFYRVTPLTWVGVLLGLTFRFNPKVELIRPLKLLSALLLITAIAFILLIGIAQGRNSPHYILSSYLSLNILAGLGWIHAIQWLYARFSVRQLQIQYAGLAIVLLIQGWSALSNFPYYFTYRNPILYSMGWYNEFPHFPYGEALEQAGQYLAKLPDAENTVLFSYYSRGCVSYYYPGQVISFRPYYADGNHATDLLNNINASDYLIVYYANQGQLPHYQTFLKVLSNVEPFHVIWMNGYEYVRIYKIDDFTPEILEAFENL